MIRYPDRLPHVGESIFTHMSALSQKYKSINLGQGFPDFSPPDKLIQLTYQYAQQGYNQYAHSAGLPELRSALSGKIERLYNSYYNPETEITITSGATESLMCAILCSINQGDEVLIIEPAYDSYEPSVRMAGGNPVFYSIDTSQGKIDWIELEKKISSKTRLLIINNPHNPLGVVLDDIDIRMLEDIVERHNLWVVSDEVYEHIFFGEKHISLSQSNYLKSRSFVISSFGKTYHNTGWKIGYCAAPQPLTQAFRKVHQFITFSTFTPAQKALSDFIEDDTWYEGLKSLYTQKRSLVFNLLQAGPYAYTPSSGSYFQTISFKTVSTLPDFEFAEYCTREVGVTVIPLSSFYHDKRVTGCVRICFAKSDDVLILGLDKLCRNLK